MGNGGYMDTEKDPQVETDNTVEVFSFDGKDAQISLKDNRIEVVLPEGLDEESQAKFKDQIKSGSKLLASLNKKHYDLNREREKLGDSSTIAALEEKIKKLEEKFIPKESDDVPLWEELGLESESQLRQFAAEYPDAYMQKLNEKSEKKLSATASKAIEQSILKQNIASLNLDEKKIQDFASYYGLEVNSKTLELYQNHHKAKRDPVVDAQIAAQSHEIVYIEKGKQSPNYKSMTLSEMKKLPDAELNALYRSVLPK